MMDLNNIRIYEKYATFQPDITQMPKIRPDVTVACILNASTIKDLECECNLTILAESCWKDTIENEKPTFLLAQPFFPEGDGSKDIWPQNETEYREITGLCKFLGIPTVFWDTEGPNAFDSHKKAAILFDYIFVVNSNVIDLYKKAGREKNVFFLPDGIQLRNHSPKTTHFGRKDLMVTKSDLCCLRTNIHNNTYTNRLNTIITTIGVDCKFLSPLGVTIITSTNRPDSMENVFKNYERQNYEPKEMVVILNNNHMDIGKWKEKASGYKNVQILKIDEKLPLGRCLNAGIDNTSFPYVSKFDDDNYYAPNFLTDLINAFSYTGTEIVGKLTYFCYFEGSHILALMCPGMENHYVNFLSGSGLVIKREVFDTVRFPDKPQGSDSVFLKDCVKNGVRMYSADRFNYVYNRHALQENHTWKISDEVFMRSCQFIANMDNYTEFVTI